MSELNSLFAKIKIKKEKFDEFLKSKPEQATLDNDWLEWWDSREMYGKTDLTRDELFKYDDPTNEDIINGWINEIRSFSFSDYDAENETWHFGIIFFSQNYSDMIPGLAFVKSVSKFKEIDSDDFAIIYNFFWGDDVCAFINFKDNKSYFDSKIQRTSDISSEIIKYADTYLHKKWEEFADDEQAGEYD